MRRNISGGKLQEELEVTVRPAGRADCEVSRGQRGGEGDGLLRGGMV